MGKLLPVLSRETTLVRTWVITQVRYNAELGHLPVCVPASISVSPVWCEKMALVPWKVVALVVTLAALSGSVEGNVVADICCA